MFETGDYLYMRKALALARKGLGLSSPNPPVGCLIVRNGEVVGRGWHEYSRLDHAEVRALREASKRARGATVVVCSHQLSEVERTCDHVAILDRGRVVASGALRTLVREGETLEDLFVRAVRG